MRCRPRTRDGGLARFTIMASFFGESLTSRLAPGSKCNSASRAFGRRTPWLFPHAWSVVIMCCMYSRGIALASAHWVSSWKFRVAKRAAAIRSGILIHDANPDMAAEYQRYIGDTPLQGGKKAMEP